MNAVYSFFFAPTMFEAPWFLFSSSSVDCARVADDFSRPWTDSSTDNFSFELSNPHYCLKMALVRNCRLSTS